MGYMLITGGGIRFPKNDGGAGLRSQLQPTGWCVIDCACTWLTKVHVETAVSRALKQDVRRGKAVCVVRKAELVVDLAAIGSATMKFPSTT